MDPYGYMTKKHRKTMQEYLDAGHGLPCTQTYNDQDLSRETMITSCAQCRYLQDHHSEDRLHCMRGMNPMMPNTNLEEEDITKLWRNLHVHSELCAGYAPDTYSNRVYHRVRPPGYTPKRYEQLQCTIARMAIAGVLSPEYQIPESWQKAHDDHVRNNSDVGSQTDPVHPHHPAVRDEV